MRTTWTFRTSPERIRGSRFRSVPGRLVGRHLPPLFGGVPGGGSGAFEIAVREEQTNLIDREHRLLRAFHVLTSRIGTRLHNLFEVGDDVRKDRFCLRGIASMKVHNQVPKACDHF